MRLPGIACSGLVALVLAGCTSVEYYWQGILGQYELLHRAQPIDQVLAADPEPQTKAKLERVVAIREFASAQLGLPDNKSYRSYSDLGRRFVLWNVFATPELSLEPRQWCFPIAGCVNYRGYFDERDARSEADRLHGDGDDVYVGGVPAYSTLGYFNDPVPSTIIRYPDIEIARLIFHELAHQVTYAKGDTVFNESFAVTVETEGVRRWIATQNDPALITQFNSSQRYRTGFVDLVTHARERLAILYASTAGDADKRAGKAQAFAAMRQDYEELKRTWGGMAFYDAWFALGPNNASLSAVSLYTQQVPQFEALLASAGGDLPRFYARVKVLAALPRTERDAALAAATAAPGHAAVAR